MFKKALILTAILSGTSAYAVETPIVGNVQAKCSIYTDTQGVYGNPSPSVLSTATADGGVTPIIRYDVASADYYTAKMTWPNAFSTAPGLPDAVNWTGDVEVAEVSDPLMSDYETNKIKYDNVVEFNLTVAGSTWFRVPSTVEYGYGKSFPAGQYTAIVTAECIAN